MKGDVDSRCADGAREAWSPRKARKAHGLSAYSHHVLHMCSFIGHQSDLCSGIIISVSNDVVKTQRGLLKTTHDKARVQMRAMSPKFAATPDVGCIGE